MSRPGGNVGLFAANSRVPGLGDHHQRRPQHPVVQQVTFLQHVHHGVGLLVALQLADSLVAVGVELLAFRVDGLDRELVEDRFQLARGELDAFLEILDRGVLDHQRP